MVVIGGVFCLSGAAALVYQVAWQRILAVHSGVGVYSVAVIVAAFLAGIGIGSWGGGVLSVRASPKAALRAFAALELAIGLFGAASCTLYYDLLYLRLPWLFAGVWPAAAVHFLLLIVPTTLMGMSLPFLVRATVTNCAAASSTVGYLYALNVLGAAAGALLTPWVLVRLLGIEGAVVAAALGNLISGLAVLILAALSHAEPVEPAEGMVGAAAARAGSGPFALWAALYTASGFCALSLEILWFRIIDVAVKSTAYTFGTVLAVYLLGLGAGSLIGGRLALRVQWPLAAFLLCQGMLILYAVAALTALVALPPHWSGYRVLVAHWAAYQEFDLGGVWDPRMIALLYIALPCFLYGPPTVLMGVSFGILQRAVHDDPHTSGLKVGILQAANIAGNVAGSLLAGLLLLEVIGTGGSLRVVLAIGMGFAGLGIYHSGWRPSFVLLLVALGSLTWFAPGQDGLWRRLHGQVDARGLFAEDATAVAAITPEGGNWRVSVNGKGQSVLPFGGIHSELGSMPAAMHPAPQRLAIVGLGSGDTAWAAAFREETRQVDVFELSGGQQRLLSRATAGDGLPQLTDFLADRRVHIRIADGRNALAVGDESYDIIEADALRPNSAYSGNIYSTEFFTLCARRLRPGGIMCTWAPTPRIYASFCAAFPYVVEVLDGGILFGSNQPIAIEPAVWAARLRTPHAERYLGKQIADDVTDRLATARPASPARCAAIEPNRDLFPRDEFRTPPGW